MGSRGVAQCPSGNKWSFNLNANTALGIPEVEVVCSKQSGIRLPVVSITVLNGSKMAYKSNLRKEEPLCSWYLRVCTPHSGKDMGHKAAGHVASTVRKQRETNIHPMG